MKKGIRICLWFTVLTISWGGWNHGVEGGESVSTCAELLPQLHAADMRVRELAYYTLSTSATRQDLKFLHHTLRKHPESRVRWRVARVIGRLGDTTSVPVLTSALNNDDSLYVRRNAAWGLGDLGEHSAFDALKHAVLTDDDPSVRKRAATALTQLGNDAAYNALEAALKREPDVGAHVNLEWLLERRGQHETDDLKIRRGEVMTGYYRGSQYLVYVPKTLWPWKRLNLLVSVHGTDGLPAPYMTMCLEDADKHDMVVIAPRFDYAAFPNYDRLNVELGAMRSDLWLLGIIDEVAKHVSLNTDKFWLFGHSKGGQFVQRFVRAHPNRIARAAASSSGSYVGSSPDLVFPEGTSPNPFMPELPNVDFGKFVLTPLAVVIGTADLASRLEAANLFMEEVRAYATQHDLPCNITLFSIPDNPHVGAKNFPTASRFLFDK